MTLSKHVYVVIIVVAPPSRFEIPDQWFCFQWRQRVCDRCGLNADRFSKEPVRAQDGAANQDGPTSQVRPHIQDGPTLLTVVSRTNSCHRKWTKNNRCRHSWKRDNNNRATWCKGSAAQEQAWRWQLWGSSKDYHRLCTHRLDLSPAHIVGFDLSNLQRSRFFGTNSEDPDFAGGNWARDILPREENNPLCELLLSFYLQNFTWQDGACVNKYDLINPFYFQPMTKTRKPSMRTTQFVCSRLSIRGWSCS